MTLKGGIVASVHTMVTRLLMEDGRRVILCVHTKEGDGLIVPGIERHVCLIEVRHVLLRQLRVFITRENAGLIKFYMYITIKTPSHDL